ncbi:branched-chain amino acid ABC transporter permease [Gordonia sp. HNM0687]|uniref:Branched-chain amino acid ABC transporter permease n=1 Tax=Gordonia mangrovi TaxID=2665643 RepID=A0A6L7GUY9_9ACTN|nr:AzlC family ABC transporter permease [Gordonia mangrovi]MXP22861.1 branched-chain amino acid ABC transporter permease [Gordonia mangrovi]UVF77169.1 AzlC family ABC transporter permease [Gordonia mangrovi]
MRSIRGTLTWSTVRTVLVMSMSVLVIGASYGVTAHSAGLAWWHVVVIATVVLAGSSEFVFVGILAAGGAPLLAALAGLVVNTRNFGYGLSVGRFLPRGWSMALGAHLINDETAAMTAAESDPRRARATFLLCGAGVLISWPLGSAIGVAIGEVVADPASLGLDAAFPALLVALAVGALRDRKTLCAALIGGTAAIAATPFLPPGLPILCTLTGLAVVARRPARTPRASGAHAEPLDHRPREYTR